MPVCDDSSICLSFGESFWGDLLVFFSTRANLVKQGYARAEQVKHLLVLSAGVGRGSVSRPLEVSKLPASAANSFRSSGVPPSAGLRSVCRLDS
jgi:hypothetical protein